MVGLAGFLVAGAAESVGSNMVEQAKAKREAALEEIRNGRLLEREQADREFRKGEREAGQAFTSGENDKTRANSAEQARLAREASGDLLTADDGTTFSRVGATATPLKDATGKPIKAAGSKTDKPAEVATAEWLIRQGVAKDAEDAWNRVRSAKQNDNQRAKLVIDTYKAMKDNDTTGRPDDQLRQDAQGFVDSLIAGEGGAATPAAGGTRPKGIDDATIIQQAKDALARGADKNAVRSRLRQMGVDPEKAGL